MLFTSLNRRPYAGIWIFIICLICLLLPFSGFLASWKWMHLEIHSTIETLGGISAILISLALFQEAREDSNEMFVMVAIGFACMGVLDTFHAMSRPGDAFVFLHSAASLAGGFFFALIWTPFRLILKNKDEQRWFAWGAVILSISIGLRALLAPADVPTILPLYNGKFTLAAILINILAGLLFLASVPKFYMAYRRLHNIQFLIFMCLALLFGLAEMIFQFSNTWDGIWWSWHLIRLSAFMITLSIVFSQYRRLSRNRSKR